MTPVPFSTKQHSGRARFSLRWLVVLIASALLHLSAIGWVSGQISLPAQQSPKDPDVMIATLQTPATAKPVITAAPPPKPKRKVRRRAAPPPIVEAQPAIQPETSRLETATEPQASDTAGSDSSTNAELASAATTTPVPAEQHDAHYKIDLPPSATLKYDVQKIPKEGQPMYGSGTIGWHTDGSKYEVNGDFGVLFITALRFKSTGTIEDAGIVPELYSEKRFRRSETNTHFHRERNTISFSASTLSYPRSGGEQDRASIMWQLAGIGRGDSEKFAPGATIDLFVAGTRDAETWHILVIGQEEITIDGETTQAWHVARAPRIGSRDQKLDIWLAPKQNWYPVRLRYTEPNGDYLDMSLTSLNVSPVP